MRSFRYYYKYSIEYLHSENLYDQSFTVKIYKTETRIVT